MVFKIIREIYKRVIWSYKADRLGPDIISTYFLMYSPILARKICEKKFYHFGENAEVRHGAVVIGCSKISLGKNVYIRPGSYIVAGNNRITIEDKVLIASGVQMHTENHEFNDISIPIFDQGYQVGGDIIIKSGAWLGANVIILPGVTVGKNAVVAAGSVVTQNVPDFSVVAGIPAKIKKVIQ
ncbi:acyltransferase [Lysinibacillus sp. 1 U-2021]|uniref:acyltransferase n=1 Tax=Lysinibacillus sp. 1 U-2021 TaxID=3039426 RepID=UPI002480FCD5|nr:acyltransferase [Lysinibacillus sp. 1 U-2021]WGT40582.1 acyltransferase [Lysinibacillus sp. 1 U-2021]